MSSLTHISNSLNSLEERLTALEKNTRKVSDSFYETVEIMISLNRKLSSIETMQAEQVKRQDHTSAFARREAGIVRDQLSDIRESIATHAGITMNALEQIETVGADLHEYARQAAEELEVYGSGVDPEIDWLNLSVKERV